VLYSGCVRIYVAHREDEHRWRYIGPTSAVHDSVVKDEHQLPRSTRRNESPQPAFTPFEASAGCHAGCARRLSRFQCREALALSLAALAHPKMLELSSSPKRFGPRRQSTCQYLNGATAFRFPPTSGSAVRKQLRQAVQYGYPHWLGALCKKATAACYITHLHTLCRHSSPLLMGSIIKSTSLTEPLSTPKRFEQQVRSTYDPRHRLVSESPSRLHATVKIVRRARRFPKDPLGASCWLKARCLMLPSC
jgi:hypothetical protein